MIFRGTHAVRSRLIELLRFGGEPGILRVGDRYLATIEGDFLSELTMPLEEYQFLEYQETLRYSIDDAECSAALNQLSAQMGCFLSGARIYFDSAASTQIDLVLRGAELAQLPFEALLGADELPVFARTEPRVVLTRRVRGNFAAHALEWPVRPRVLLAIASPGDAGKEVPADEHKVALRKALKPWIEPLEGFPTPIDDGRNVLTILTNTTLEALRSECQSSVDKGNPYTHIHLLAHGVSVGNRPHERFGLALHNPVKPGVLPATPEELVESLRALVGKCVAVTLAVCDGGNATNTLTPRKNIAHALHVAGFPIVLASQMPLTFPGSVLLAERFYTGVLRGGDVREALHEVRVALYQERANAGGDWASVVAYVRLPEGYADRLVEIEAATHLGALETFQRWSDHLIKHSNAEVEAFDRVATLGEERIQSLQQALARLDAAPGSAMYQEYFGLLASAYKRLAELYFRRWTLSDPKPLEPSRQMHEALQESMRLYQKSHSSNLSAHWTMVQYLSLCVVLDGKILKPWMWDATLEAATQCALDGKDVWSLGSLTELYLLARGTRGPDCVADACTAVRELARRAQAAGKLEAIVSTRRQLTRYTTWWTQAHGFFKGGHDLAVEAQQVIDALDTN